jgi:hypothetical protein
MDTGRNIWIGLLALVVATTVASAPASAQQQQKPNILVILGNDIGYWNISAYNCFDRVPAVVKAEDQWSEASRYCRKIC